MRTRDRYAQRDRVLGKLRTSEDHFRSAFDNAAIGMALVAPDGHFLKVNRSLCEIVGYSEEELLAMSFQAITHPDDLQTDLEYVRQMLAGKIRTYRMEKRDFHKLEHIVWILLSVSLVYDAEGEPMYFIAQIQDLTERKQAGEAFRTVYDNSLVAIYIVQGGAIQFINSQFERQMGYSRSELLGADPLSFVVPQDRAMVRENAMKRLKGNRSSAYEYRVLTKAGETRWVVETVTSIQYRGERAVLGELMDITDRKMAEEDVRRYRQDRENVFQSIGHPIVILDRDHRVLAANHTAATVLGKLEEDLRGRYCYEIFHGTDAPIAGCPMELALKSQGQESAEVEVQTIGGIFLTSCTPVVNDEGQIDKIIHIATDITDRKKAENALRESEERYRTLVETSPEAIVLTDLESRITMCNQTAAEMYGVGNADELVGRNAFELIAPEDQERAAANALKVLGGTSIRNVEYTAIRRDGTRVPVEVSVSPLGPPGENPRSFMAIIRDISQRKEAADNLNASLAKLRRTLEGTIEAMALTVETRDPYTAGHQRRVAQLAGAISEEMRLSQEQVRLIRMAGVIHDIGKIGVPSEILSKPGRINEFEFSLIKAHPRIGYDILKTIEFPWPLAEIVLQHHEMMDGSGYPLGRKGREILLEARIVAVADVVEAMASHRPYRPALGIGSALEEIVRTKAIQFDSDVVDACVRLFANEGFEFAESASLVPLEVLSDRYE